MAYRYQHSSSYSARGEKRDLAATRQAADTCSGQIPGQNAFCLPCMFCAKELTQLCLSFIQLEIIFHGQLVLFEAEFGSLNIVLV